LSTSIPVLALPLGAIERLLQQIRHAGEYGVLKPRLQAYCTNAEAISYGESQEQRDVAVINQVRTRDRPEEHFLHVFRLAEGTFETALPHGYMPDFLKLRSLYARFREDDYYESQTLARDLYARPVLEGWNWDCRDLSPSLAFELLGLPDLQQARPTKPDVQALLAKTASLARIDGSIFAVPRSSCRSSYSSGGSLNNRSSRRRRRRRRRSRSGRSGRSGGRGINHTFRTTSRGWKTHKCERPSRTRL
jgi:hypothetical protein